MIKEILLVAFLFLLLFPFIIYFLTGLFIIIEKYFSLFFKDDNSSGPFGI